LRSFYGLGRVTAKARASIAISLEQAGLDVLSDPSSEPLIVAKPVPAPAPPAPGSPDESPGNTRRRSLIALGVLVLLVIVGIALSGGDEETQQAANSAPAPTTEPAPAATETVPPEPTATLADAQRAVRNDDYDRALAIAVDLDQSDERRIRRGIANRLAGRAERALTNGDRSRARRLLAQAANYAATGNVQDVRADLRAADEQVREERAAARQRALEEQAAEEQAAEEQAAEEQAQEEESAGAGCDPLYSPCATSNARPRLR
jgi:hypothetical protein